MRSTGRRIPPLLGLGLTAMVVTAAHTSVTGAFAAQGTGTSTCISANGPDGRFEYRGPLAEWLTCLYPPGSRTARAQRLSGVIMPGSHSAGTDTFYRSEATTFDQSRECPSTVGPAAPGLPWVTRQWAMAQTRSTAEQAALGSRWFELKGVLDNYVWRSCDGLVGDRWFDVVNDLVGFETSHPGEVQVIDMAQLLDPITDVSASRLVQALTPACQRAVTTWSVTGMRTNPATITVQEARAAGGFVILMGGGVRSGHAFGKLERWLAQHPSSACAAKVWPRRGTTTHVDHARLARLWPHRRDLGLAAVRLVRWQNAHVVDDGDFFQLTQFTWDIAGPSRAMPYQIWLMNHWLIDYNERLAKPTRRLAHALWVKECTTGIRANVVLLDNISHERPLRELIADNVAPCPTGKLR